MNVTKIGSFTNEEIEALKKAGTIISSAAKAFSAGEITVLDETSKQLLEALKEVLGRIE